jgi:chromosome partitioning protein
LFKDPFVSKQTGVLVSDLEKLAQDGHRLLKEEQVRILEPYPRKRSPLWPIRQLAELCGTTPLKISNLIGRGLVDRYPTGIQQGRGKVRRFTIDDVYAWREILKPSYKRRCDDEEITPGKVIVVSNLKGGTGKSSTVVPLAQALALNHGRRVLVVDLDPQGTTTQLCGWAPDLEVREEMTVAPFLEGNEVSLHSVIEPTYWKNVDCIRSCADLLGLELILSQKMQDPNDINYRWNGLKNGFSIMALDYDVIIVDTAPSLSQLTISALIAADGLVIPVQPSPLDFAASTSYFGLLEELLGHVYSGGNSKVFDFINILITRDDKSAVNEFVSSWIRRAYGEYVLPMSIPDSRAVKNAYAAFGTVYDHPEPVGSDESHNRFKQPFDEFVAHINSVLEKFWKEEEANYV